MFLCNLYDSDASNLATFPEPAGDGITDRGVFLISKSLVNRKVISRHGCIAKLCVQQEKKDWQMTEYLCR